MSHRLERIAPGGLPWGQTDGSSATRRWDVRPESAKDSPAAAIRPGCAPTCRPVPG